MVGVSHKSGRNEKGMLGIKRGLGTRKFSERAKLDPGRPKEKRVGTRTADSWQ